MKPHLLEMTEAYADYLHDESRRTGRAEKIVFPKTTETVCAALKQSNCTTIQGGRTGITGGAVPEGGLVLNLSRMDRTEEITDSKIIVQPGATLTTLRNTLTGTGLFFPADPTETSATIGGMVSNNASGARSFHYGSIRQWIHALQVVLPHGEAVRIERGVDRLNRLDFTLGTLHGTLPKLSQPNVKNAAGYFVQPNMDLVDLFIGAEGTLGVITEITLQLLPCPATTNGLLAFFASEKEALDFVVFLRQAGQAVAIEFFDADALDLLRKSDGDFPKLKPEFHTALYFEYEGDVPESVLEQTDAATLDCWFAEDERELQPLKAFRHALPEAVNQWIAERKREFPELTKLGTDMAVPDHQLEAVMQMYHDGLTRADLKSVIFGHIGNNHLHVNILPHNLDEYKKGTTLYLEWAKKVIAMGGSISAEHGIGKSKTAFLKLMMGEDGITKLQKIKSLFDPHSQLNPGNILDNKFQI